MKYRGKCILMVQKMIRGFLARKQHQPRIKGIIELNLVRKNLAKTKDITNQLKTNKDAVLNQVQDLDKIIQKAVNDIRVSLIIVCVSLQCHFKIYFQNNNNIKSTQIDALCSDIMLKLEKQNNGLKAQLQVSRK